MRLTVLVSTIQRTKASMGRVGRGIAAKTIRYSWGERLLRGCGMDTERMAIAARYDASYYETGHTRKAGHTGYGTYKRADSNANHAAYLAASYFPPGSVLDIGCAKGHFVTATRELGRDARGVDLSAAAIAMADSETSKYLSVGALPDAIDAPATSIGLLTLFETLEHLRPQDIPSALRELRRVCSGYVLATIPSIGANTSGPDGWCNGKVLDARLEHYQALGRDYDGPVPFEDLAVDEAGDPMEGHLTVASYRWWREAFKAAGFESCERLERFMTYDATRFGLIEFWCIYVFRVPDAPEPQGPELDHAHRVEIEETWDLVSSSVPEPVIQAAIARLKEIDVPADGNALA